MIEMRRSASIYLAGLAVAALAAVGFALSRATVPDSARLLLAAGLAGLVILAYLYPLHFAYKTKVSLGTSVVFATVLLFEPAAAMSIALVGVAVAHVIRREPLVQTVFNAAQTTLSAGAAGLILALVDWRTDQFIVWTPSHVAGLLLAAGAMYLVNSVAVAVIVALQAGLPFWLVWRQSVTFGRSEDACQFILGLLAAVTVDVHLWTLPLFLMPAVILYRSLERHIQLREQTIDALDRLADIVDLRDPYTAHHSRRVATYARELAAFIELSPDEVDLIERAARVHDIGKLVVDQVVLGKPGKLDPDEWRQLQRHPVTGAEILSRFPQLALATSYVLHHHESMDGSGYPDGLSGEAIPLGARVIAVADSFDAMASARPYRSALPNDVILNEFRSKRGIQWDANVVDALLALLDAGRLAFPDATHPPRLFDRHGEQVPLPAAV
jgi:HD-GYP domain-containing protein (c-di-GMP phosphodiesterase class II)